MKKGNKKMKTDFLVVSTDLAKETSPIAAFVFAALHAEMQNVSPEEMKEHKGEKYFPVSAERLEEITSLKRRPQERAIKELLEAGIIDTTLFGLPATKHFTFKGAIA